MIILDGQKVATQKLESLKDRVKLLDKKLSLGIIMVGNNSSSKQYVNIKKKRAEELGISTEILHLDSYSQENIEKMITNGTTTFTGLMIQLPIPGIIDRQAVLDLIPKQLDVDGLCSGNLDLIPIGNELFCPAVVNAVTDIISVYQIETDLKSIVVIGDSPYVGIPMYNRLQYLYGFFTKDITIIGEDTKNSKNLISSADIVISCIGKPHIYNSKILKENAILIDVGTSPNKANKIVGDFAIDPDSKIAAYTPIPGGIGPLTVANLLENVVLAAESNF